MSKNEILEQDLQCILNPILAKRLFNKGYGIFCVDIKPNKHNKSATVFLFKRSDEVMFELASFAQEQAEKEYFKKITDGDF